MTPYFHLFLSQMHRSSCFTLYMLSRFTVFQMHFVLKIMQQSFLVLVIEGVGVALEELHDRGIKE